MAYVRAAHREYHLLIAARWLRLKLRTEAFHDRVNKAPGDAEFTRS
jgi:hypothetical protein